MTSNERQMTNWYSGLPLHWKISLPFAMTFFWLWLIGTSALGYYLSQRLEEQQIKRTKTLTSLVAEEFEEEKESLRLDARLLANEEIVSNAVSQADRNTLLQHLLPLRAILQTDLMLIVDRNKQSLMDSRERDIQAVDFQLDKVENQLLAGADLATIVTSDGEQQPAMVIGAAPIKDLEGIQGGILLGNAIDEDLLKQIKKEINEELVAFKGDRIFASTFPEETEIDPEELVELSDPMVKIGKKRYISQSLVLSGIDEDIRLVILSDRKDLQQARRALWLGIGFISLLGGGIAIVVGYWIGNTITRPVREVTTVAQKVTQEKNFDLRAVVTTQDEVGTLATALNQLIQWTGQYTEELETAGAMLEQRVEERTQELSHALADLKTTQAQLIQTEKMSGLGQMVAGIAHEVNNPINFIHGNVSYIQEYVRDLLDLVELYQTEGTSTPVIQQRVEEIDLDFLTEDLEKILGSVRLGTERVREIVISLRNFSRLDEAAVKAVDLHEGLESTLLILNHRLKQGFEVVKHYGKLPLVQCAPAQLNQVFTNIITNAMDAMEEAESQPKQIILTTQSLAEQRQVQIRIGDTGPGIPEKVKAKIFDPFFTTKPVGKGTGLGLGICFQIIEKHQGQLEVLSEIGQGTEFVITLPVQAVS
ncbi:MAG: ATP-binding protein [Microcoleaceae cyanobacterium]